MHCHQNRRQDLHGMPGLFCDMETSSDCTKGAEHFQYVAEMQLTGCHIGADQKEWVSVGGGYDLLLETGSKTEK